MQLKPGKILFIFICFFMCLPVYVFGATSAGTSVESQALLFYNDKTVSSEFSGASVSQIYGLELYPTFETASIPGGEFYYFPVTLENIGNGTAKIFLSGFSTLPGWSTQLLVDDNRDEIHQDSETLIVSSEIILAEDADYKFFLYLDAPDSAYIGTHGDGYVIATTEVIDGPSYFGANGNLYGGEDQVVATRILSIECLGNLRIWRNNETGDISVSWGGGPSDIYYRDVFSTSFEASSVEAASVTSPWTSEAISAQDGITRYYRVAAAGTKNFATGIVGKFDVQIEEGINQLSLPFVPEYTNIPFVVGSQVTGSNNAGDADRVWKYNPNSQAYYDIAWLVGGVGPEYDGQWYTGNQPTTLSIEADEGFLLQIRTGHSTKPVTFVGRASENNRQVTINPGMNFIGTCYPIEISLSDANFLLSGATGASNAGDADRVWSFNKNVQAQYDIAWLVSGTGTSYDGKWFTGNKETTITLIPGKGYWFQRRPERTQFTWDYTKPY